MAFRYLILFSVLAKQVISFKDSEWDIWRVKSNKKLITYIHYRNESVSVLLYAIPGSANIYTDIPRKKAVGQLIQCCLEICVKQRPRPKQSVKPWGFGSLLCITANRSITGKQLREKSGPE